MNNQQMNQLIALHAFKHSIDNDFHLFLPPWVCQYQADQHKLSSQARLLQQSCCQQHLSVQLRTLWPEFSYYFVNPDGVFLLSNASNLLVSNRMCLAGDMKLSKVNLLICHFNVTSQGQHALQESLKLKTQ